MIYAEVTGWGRCLPPAVLTNSDIATVLDTSSEWIVSRTGIRERRISHVTNAELGRVAAARALAAAGVSAEQVDMIAFATTTPDEVIPNTGSILKNALGANNAAVFDLNAACSGFLYAFNMLSDMIRCGSIKTAVIVGSERLSLLMNWSRRESAILFGDGAGAVVLEASENQCGFIAGKLGCVPDTRELLAMPDFGLDAIAQYRQLNVTLDFSGREIFKHAVKGMGDACEAVFAQAGIGLDDVDLIIPHQANARIVEAVVKRIGGDMEKVVLTLDKYANTSTSSIPIALVEALEQGHVKPGMNILFTAFGAGLTWGASLFKWGERVEPLGTTEESLPTTDKSALDLIQEAIERRRAYEQS